MTIDVGTEIGRVALFLGVPFLILIFVMQYKWAKTCEANIRVLVAHKSGAGSFQFAPKDGGSISITNPTDGTIRVWAVNELATIDVPYPGVGFLPKWMQKSIRLAVVNEGDWEPMLNRSPHRENIASPDIAMYLKSLSERIKNEDVKEEISGILSKISTSPTREMIADPSTLGNLMQSSVMKALATVSNDLMEALKSVNAKLGKMMNFNPMIMYIGLGIVAILVAVMIFKVLPMVSEFEELTAKLDAISRSLGIAQ